MRINKQNLKLLAGCAAGCGIGWLITLFTPVWVWIAVAALLTLMLIIDWNDGRETGEDD